MLFVAVQNGRVSYFVPVVESMAVMIATGSGSRPLRPLRRKGRSVCENRWNGSRRLKTICIDYDEMESRMILWLADYLGDDFHMTHKLSDHTLRWRTPDFLSRLEYLTSLPSFHTECRNLLPLLEYPHTQPHITRGGNPQIDTRYTLFRNVGK